MFFFRQKTKKRPRTSWKNFTFCQNYRASIQGFFLKFCLGAQLLFSFSTTINYKRLFMGRKKRCICQQYRYGTGSFTWILLYLLFFFRRKRLSTSQRRLTFCKVVELVWFFLNFCLKSHILIIKAKKTKKDYAPGSKTVTIYLNYRFGKKGFSPKFCLKSNI